MANKNSKPRSQLKPKSFYMPDFSMRPSSGRLYAQKMTKLQSAHAHFRVITRAKALYAVTLLSFYFAATVLHTVLYRHGITHAVGEPLTTANAALQVTASGYFIIATNRDNVALVLKLVMVFTGIQFFIGLSAYGPLAFTLVSVAIQYYAYIQVSSLRFDGL
jgi:hypothetical protein